MTTELVILTRYNGDVTPAAFRNHSVLLL